MQPVLENAVGEFAGLAFRALGAVSEVRARNGGVVHFARVPAPRLFSAMGERALCPVVVARFRAFLDFESVHTELVGAVNRVLGAVGGEVLERACVEAQVLHREIEETWGETQVFPHYNINGETTYIFRER